MKLISTLRHKLAPLIIVLALLTGLNAAPATVLACGNGTGSSRDQVLNGVGETGNDCNPDGVNSTIATAVNILSLVVGTAAIIMLLVSAFKYMTSNGDPAKISNAKTTLIYALIGLAIVGLAETLVHLVLSTATNATIPPPNPKT